MFATSSVVVKRPSSDVGRIVFRKFCSACAWVMPSASAFAFIQFDRISEFVGPGSTELTVTPVPATDSATPLAIAS